MTDKAQKLGEQQVGATALQEGLTHNSHVEIGMTLRQHYAGLALQGMADYDTMQICTPQTLAKHAVEMADALLEELSK